MLDEEKWEEILWNGIKYSYPFTDFFLGLENKYPLCCILFYITGWEEINDTINNVKRLDNLTSDATKAVDDYAFSEEHVICPNCVITKLSKKH